MASLAANEPTYGTASQIRRWILVEQPGTWGTNAVVESDLPDEVAIALRRIAKKVRARLLLIRRFGRYTPAQRTCFVAVTTPDVQRLERFVVDDVGDLLGLDWSPLHDHQRVGGEELDEPVYLVCTNGRHDACCAEFGRPVARTLSDVFGDSVWESSHFGGDRFAGNLVCLPDGIYYGRVTPDEAETLVKDHQQGHLDLDRYRGRSAFPFVAQAAEALVRRRQALTAIAALTPTRVSTAGEQLFDVALRTADGATLTARVECTPGIDPQQLTCRSTTKEHPPRYRLVDVS